MKKNPIKKLLPYTIYLFQKDKILYGVARADVNKEEIFFGQGFKIEKDKNSKLNTLANMTRRARRSVVASVSNSLNAVQMFGKKVLDKDGQVNWEQFQIEEFKRAFELAKQGKDKKYDKKVFDFKTIEISYKVAKDNNLI